MFAHALLSMTVQSYRFRVKVTEEIQQQILCHTDLVAPHELKWGPVSGLAPFDCCKRCTDALDACYCSSKHAAFAPTCTCWTMPNAMFQLSRKMGEESTRIFYSMNHFVVLPEWGRDVYPGAFRSLPILQFLRLLPQNALESLRSMRWVFPQPIIYLLVVFTE